MSKDQFCVCAHAQNDTYYLYQAQLNNTSNLIAFGGYSFVEKRM